MIATDKLPIGHLPSGAVVPGRQAWKTKVVNNECYALCTVIDWRIDNYAGNSERPLMDDLHWVFWLDRKLGAKQVDGFVR